MDRKEFKKEFKKVFFNTLKKNSFKRVKKKWLIETDELIKEVDLQKSDYSDLYYLNYDFTVKGIDTSPTLTHLSFRFNKKRELLDLENDLEKEKRLALFEKMIDEMVETKINPINTIKELLEMINENPFIKNMIFSKAFKEHFGMKD